MAHVLILAALPEEADALFPGEGTVADHLFPVRRLSAHGHELIIATCGLGKVHAALAAGLFGAEADLLLMSGTCGALSASPGRAYWLAEAVQHDYGAAQPGSFRRYRAGEWPAGEPGAAHFTAMADPGLGLPHARIASGDSFIACPDAASDLAADLGAMLVDMEVGALAQVAARLGKPWAAIKAVTDAADEGSSRDFHANLVRAARAAAVETERLVAQISLRPTR